VAGEARPASPIRLVVGLGNPEPRYARSRHNAGQMVVEALAERLGARWRSRYRGRFAEARGPAGPLALLVPLTYMNLSGDSVGPASGSLHLEPAQVLVVHDEIDLPFGDLRVKFGGGDNGHNGLKSIRRSLGTGDFYRVRLGVGRPPGRQEAAAYLLTHFSSTERRELDVHVQRAADAVESLVTEGLQPTQNLFNS